VLDEITEKKFQRYQKIIMYNNRISVGNTRTTERGGESVVYKLKQFYAF
jgi:hypothetical protein